MPKSVSLLGKKFGRLTVYKKSDLKKGYWHCKCECGSETHSRGTHLTSGTTVSCGCSRKGKRSHLRKSYIGEKFGKLTVIEEFEKEGIKYRYAICSCDCGNITNKPIRITNLKSGHTVSCGCQQIDKAKANINKPKNDITGHRFGRLLVLGISKERIYNQLSWECVCDCGNKKILTTDRLTSGRTKSCGCLNIEMSTERFMKIRETQFGENHPLYNPNLTDEDRFATRNYDEYYQWRKDVYKRDNYACQCCGIKKRINAHHIVNYSTFKEGRININNGITLCYDCHVAFHSIYGNKKNNLDQLNEFISYNSNKEYTNNKKGVIEC